VKLLALITTTVNVPTVLDAYVAHVPPGWELAIVVAGDAQTPPATRAFVENLGGVYLGVEGDSVERWATHRAVGLRSIQRRNVALLHALTLGPDVVVTVDDDNRPLDPERYLASFVDGFTRDATSVTRSSTGWYNPGHVLDPPVHHRGYPLDQRRDRGRYVTGRDRPTMAGGEWPPRVGVVAGLWFGDPDVDAIERIVNSPGVTGFRSGSGARDVVLGSGTWAPFNTQNTAYAWPVAPLMQCLVGVGRYDDIWMSYVARWVMEGHGWTVRYGYPLAIQARNDHDLLDDLENELYGYRNTPELVRQLRLHEPPATSPLDALEVGYDVVACVGVPGRTLRACEAWLDDAEVAVVEGERRRRERGVD
jgi:hypothetical protein